MPVENAFNATFQWKIKLYFEDYGVFYCLFKFLFYLVCLSVLNMKNPIDYFIAFAHH